MTTPPIYLDYNATTPVLPEVLASMLPYFSEKFGNPASATHRYGWEAEAAVKLARRALADVIGAESPECIAFTSGATEANNLVLQGAFAATPIQNPHFIVQGTEHKSVLDPVRFLETQGANTTVLDVDSFGRVSPEALENAITNRTVLVSIMAANNEIGTLQNIAALAATAHRHPQALFHSDMAQALGKIPIDLDAWGVDLASFSAHKLYGPKGIGALYVSKRLRPLPLFPLLRGGGHERGLRSGTLPTPLIAGFGKAAEIAARDLASESTRLSILRDSLWKSLSEKLPGIFLNGHPTELLPNTLNVSVEGVDGDALIGAMPTLAISSGSACSSASKEPSYVLQAIGRSPALSKASLRFSLGRGTTEADIEKTADTLIRTVSRLRQQAIISG